MNNNIAISENNSFFKEKLKDMKSLDNKTKKYKQIKIKNFKLSSKRERYISLLKKYNLNDIKPKTKIIDDSKTNNNTLGSSTTKDYSKTNIQVEGVDEADIIKTDGDYIYSIILYLLLL